MPELKSRAVRIAAIVAAIAATTSAVPTARALTPEQIGVIVNTGSEGSAQVARHYMTARQIPEKNLLPVTLGPQAWNEKAYQERLVRPLRAVLKDRKLDETIKCLVLTYDLPLTVPGTQPTDEERKEREGYQRKLDEFAAELEAGAVAYAGLSATRPDTGPATTSAPATSAAAEASTQAAASATARKPREPQEVLEIQKKVATAAQAAAERISKLPADQRAAAMPPFLALHQKLFGGAGVLSLVAANESASTALKAKMSAMALEVRTAETRAADLARGRATPQTRRELFNLRRTSHGVIGAANQAMQLMTDLAHMESSACLDSELSLLWEDAYPRARWLNNPMSLDAWPQIKDKARIPRVMMIARVDGLTPAAAMEMINTTLKVEKAGLEGVCYIDARGIQSPGYKPYDMDMQKAADFLTQHANMQVVLDKEESLLKAENCPDAALYCGWYSLHKYVDSAQWKPGAVGYHVASFEMGSLHEEKETGWVSNLLRRGFCGTLGATEEPYLPSFPKASQFFPLLMCGEFTQGEVYYVTNPWLSWRTGYVGDPLYNPFKAKPALAPAKVKDSAELSRAWEILDSVGLGPRKPTR